MHVLYRILELLDLACDLVTLRCVLDGHVEVPHLADAEKDRYSSLFKDVDVGTAWRSCVISKTQGPIYPGGLPVCKNELGLGRDVLIGDDVLHWFDGLSKTLDCMPAAHRSGTSIVQNRIGRVVLRVDDRRHQLCCQKAVICCDGRLCSETVSDWTSFSWMAFFPGCSYASWNAINACPVLDVSWDEYQPCSFHVHD